MPGMNDDDLKRLIEAMQRENLAGHAETRRHFDGVSEATRRCAVLVGLRASAPGATSNDGPRSRHSSLPLAPL